MVRGNSDVMVNEGDTEDTGSDQKEKEEQELKVKYEKGLLSVNAKMQPLVVVLYAIANEMNIPLEVRNEVADPVNVSIAQTSVDSVLQQLGPNIRLYVRANLQLQERRPLRKVLVAPETKSLNPRPIVVIGYSSFAGLSRCRELMRREIPWWKVKN